ncbi:MAG: hypothetical protein GWP63_22850 [Haliea sp.]|jgi:hypothetical protein|nr:hypothetical protein [Haliea sp.]
MNSDILTRWTTIVTNFAVVVGLGFVGLEFRNQTNALEAERIDSFVQGISDINSITLENEDLTEILYQAYADPESLTGSDLDRAQHWMLTTYNNFMRVHLAYQSGMLSDDIYEVQKAGIGFAFSSDIGFRVIEIMRPSGLGENLWDLVKESAVQARTYCLDPQNACIARYEASRATED